MTVLSHLKSLKSLDLSGTQVSDVTALANLKHLERLTLTGTPVRDLTPLGELASLQRLNLDGTPVSKEAVEKLQKALPKQNIQPH